MTYNQIILLVYIGLVVIMSLISFTAFLRDKKLAVKGKDRTKEKTLLFLSVFFGAPGAFLGRIVARHKTDKGYFSIVIYFSLLCEIALAIYLGVLAGIVAA